jgi:hypothetical protein
MLLMDIDAQGSKSRGGQIFAKSLGGSRFLDKISRGYTILYLIAFLLTSFQKFGWESDISYPPYPFNLMG